MDARKAHMGGAHRITRAAREPLSDGVLGPCVLKQRWPREHLPCEWNSYIPIGHCIH